MTGRKPLPFFVAIAAFLVALNFFFVSIKLLGAFKSVGMLHGKDYILLLAQNPVLSLLIGIVITCIIQSSSATTSIVVGLVGSFAFGEDLNTSIYIAIPFVMGANIGTSVTNALVSLGHLGNKEEFQRAFASAIVHDIFNLLTVFVFLPLQIYTNFLGKSAVFMAQIFQNMGGLKFVSPIKYMIQPQAKLLISFFESSFVVSGTIVFFMCLGCLYFIRFIVTRILQEKNTHSLLFIVSLIVAIMATFSQTYRHLLFNRYSAQFIFALFLLFFSLVMIVKITKGSLMGKIEPLFHKYIFKTMTRAFVLGIILTALVQSSSVTTSLLVPLAGAGILSIHQVFPFTLGANIGTTVTAILASLATGQINAVAVAFSHLIFNILGIVTFFPLRRFPIWLAQKFAVLASRSRFIPIIAIITMYFVLPLIIILILRR